MTNSLQVTTRDIAAANGVTIRTAQRWAKTGKLNARKTGRTWSITLTAPTLTDYKPAQITRAMELIEQGGILRTSRTGIYTAVSSDGTTTYLVHAQTCTCPAGLHGRRCYHTAAVAIMQASLGRAA